MPLRLEDGTHRRSANDGHCRSGKFANDETSLCPGRLSPGLRVSGNLRRLSEGIRAEDEWVEVNEIVRR